MEHAFLQLKLNKVFKMFLIIKNMGYMFCIEPTTSLKRVIVSTEQITKLCVVIDTKGDLCTEALLENAPFVHLVRTTDLIELLSYLIYLEKFNSISTIIVSRVEEDFDIILRQLNRLCIVLGCTTIIQTSFKEILTNKYIQGKIKIIENQILYQKKIKNILTFSKDNLKQLN